MSERFPRLVLDLLITLAVFAVLAIIGAAVWNQVTHPPVFVRTAQGAEMDQLRLSGLFALDGWYAVIAGVLGLIGGLIVLWWRSLEAVWVLIAGVISSLAAAWLMIAVGRQIGPSNPGAVLQHAPVGAKAPVQLSVADHHFLWSVHGHHLISFSAPSVAIMWPLGAVLGMLLVLMFSSGTSGSAPVPSPEATAEPEST
ncbi:MAG TPA: hypothetical protein VF426_10160 [Marmoricola sp.]